MGQATLEITLILALILFNGVLSMSEIALVSARKIRLQQRADQGDEKACQALKLAENPSQFLSTVQVGITLVGTLSGAYGGATLAEVLAAALEKIPLLAPYSDGIALGFVVLLITFFTLILGELVPKRLGLNNPETIAATVARPMQVLSLLTKPAVRLLNFSTDQVLRLFRVHPSDEPPVTEEEIKLLIKQGAHAGVFEQSESDMVTAIFRLGDRRVGSLMTPRTEIEWLDLDDSPSENLCKIKKSTHSRFPLGKTSLDNIQGVLAAKDLLVCDLDDPAVDFRKYTLPPVFVPENMPAMNVLEVLRQDPQPALVMVIDEYGGLQGLVTAQDILGAIVGELPFAGSLIEPDIVQRADGSWLVDGRIPIDEFIEAFRKVELPEDERGYYQTLGGYVMTNLGKMPQTGDTFIRSGLKFEVADMDGMRVDKVLIMPLSEWEI